MIFCYRLIVSALLACLVSPTREASGPGYVQVEVLGGIYEHVEVPVWLRRRRGHRKHAVTFKSHISYKCVVETDEPEFKKEEARSPLQ